MPIDASIYSQFAPAAKSVQDYQDDELMREARRQGIASNQLAMQSQRQKLDEYNRGAQDQGELRNVLASLAPGATRQQQIEAARRLGSPYAQAQADSWEKSALERLNIESLARERNSTAGKNEQATAIKGRQDAYVEAAAFNTPEDALASLNRAVQAGKVPMQAVPGLQRMVQTDPLWKLKLMQGALDPEKLKEALMPHFQAAGGAMVNTNPLAGPVGQGQPNAIPITQSRDNIANNATQRRRDDMVDARARDANTTQKLLLNQERQLKVDELQDKADQRTRQKQGAIASVESQLGVIDKAIQHPGRATSTGLSGTLDPRNYVPGTDATDFRAVLDQIGGAAFLQAFESLKGGGAITEIEGKKATDAMARLNRAQSDDEFSIALKDLRKVMTDGYKRLSGKDYGGAEAAPEDNPAPVEYDAEKERRYQEWKRNREAK